MALDLSVPPQMIDTHTPTPLSSPIATSEPIEDACLEETLEYPEIAVYEDEDWDDIYDNDGFDEDPFEMTYADYMEEEYFMRNRRHTGSRLEHKSKNKHERINIDRCVSARSVKKELAKDDLDLTARYIIMPPKTYDTPVTPIRIRPIPEKRIIRDNTPPPTVSYGAYFNDPYYAAPQRTSSKSSGRSTLSTAEIERRYQEDLRRAVQASASAKHESGLTLGQLLELSNRDLTPEDYELLLLLDNTVQKKTLKADAIAKFDERELGADDPCITANDCCSVCLVNYAQGERVKVLPCSHVFHCDCIVPWLKAHSQACPLCNTKLTQ